MILTVRLNSDDTKIYRLTNWNAANFSTGLTLTVQGSDLTGISADFAEITKLEIYQDDILVATYSDIDTYDEITFIKNEYVPGEQRFSDALRIHLTKVDIISQVQRIDEQLNPVIDIEAMSLNETKEYKIKQIGAICRAEIYAGEDVTLSDESVKHYTYDSDDQKNILSAISLIFAARQLGFTLEYVPYHSSGHECELTDYLSMVNIYMTLQLRLTRLTTKCNMLNCMIRECEDKDDVLAITWDTPLKEEYQNRYNEMITSAIETAHAMAEAMKPEVEPDSENNEENE